MIEFLCPHCSKLLHIEEKYAGQRGNCKNCGNEITITPTVPLSAQMPETASIPSLIQHTPLADVLELFPGYLSELGEDRLLQIHELLTDNPFIQKRVNSMIESKQRDLPVEFRVGILHTCGRYYTEHAAYLQAKEEGQLYKRWVSAGDEEVSTFCAHNESQRWISIDETFPSGHQHAPAHAEGCRCTVKYSVELIA